MKITKPEQTSVNDSGTGPGSDTGLTHPRSGFDLEDTRRDLIAMRNRHGANTPKGHACSNVIEQLDALRTYIRPAWASHESQTLPAMMRRQMDRLSS